MTALFILNKRAKKMINDIPIESGQTSYVRHCPLGFKFKLQDILFVLIIICLFTLVVPANAQDTTPPIPFSIIYPYNKTELKDMTFAWSASADDVGIESYELYLNNELKASVDSSILYITLSNPLSDGAYTVYIIAKDYAGNKTKTPEITVYANSSAPSIKIYIDNEEIPSGSPIRRMPLITVSLLDSAGIDKNSIKLVVDDKIVNTSIQAKETNASYPSECTLSYSVPDPLSAGMHTIKVEATDQFGYRSISALNQLEVKETATITGFPINYPNPFKPKHSQATKISYSLSNDAYTTIYIYDLNGQILKRFSISPGEETSAGVGSGGRQGYNEVIWDGKTDYGNIVGNGVYIYFIVSAEKILGRGQLAVYD
ncbi:hypothetical protein A2230_07365 [candidate division WOR-1 bacterium RIFOXYA2_FULL_36_21]|uniref:FlgD Ig-like domain-containing protein n=1 Tax=candidate division WOR-1 bacterium RIFOXYB2_FULL_36_35 TaxID=1802578 RepID=A0A1F4S8R8_UNCSA|nr:MAG: hypothetical protein A2230_07365 [candidate division WOR-1 bacterium RIFOXYA2_FULL_36_21]OGC16804.1 MAG: hypothetical protein A2290_07965 [candidate division WOR-1 bacterium RIFOXYB2_FULL_36_35]OGC19819.1 MAG: hypothetical protein A2282_01115 [candidate division WOR-1 bacterium RIFOXYA12_FULL_36_13]